MDLRSSIDSDETIGSVGSAASRSDLLATARQRFPLSAPSPNDHFLTPTYTSAAAAGGAIYTSLLEGESSLLHFTQSRMARFLFSSSSSSNESPDSNSPAAQAAAARRRLQQLLNLRSLSSSSQRGSTQSLKSSIESLQSLPVSARSSPIYSVYKSAVNVGVEEDVLVMDALGESVQMTCRARKPLELLSSSSSSSSINSSHFGPNFFKTEICRSWDECGYCRFGFRCQFAHGKEELRCITGSAKLKQESGKQSPALGSDGYYNKYSRCATMLQMNSRLSSSEPPSSFSSSSQMIQLKNGSENTKISVHGTQGSESTFSWPPTEEEEAEIKRVLYEPSQRHRRLPVFQEFYSTPEET